MVGRCPPIADAADWVCQKLASLIATDAFPYQCPFPPSSTRHSTACAGASWVAARDEIADITETTAIALRFIWFSSRPAESPARGDRRTALGADESNIAKPAKKPAAAIVTLPRAKRVRGAERASRTALPSLFAWSREIVIAASDSGTRGVLSTRGLAIAPPEHAAAAQLRLARGRGCADSCETAHPPNPTSPKPPSATRFHHRVRSPQRLRR